MVSFWPWKGDDTSPASFEKALSSLSAKISKSSSKLDGLRQRSRRLKGLWTLYSAFAYLVYAVVLVLVIGWHNWGPVEYTGVTVGPGLIYVGRLLLSMYYDYRTSTVQANLDELERQRNETIEKLKAATKYNSTQELLKKYGGTPTPKEKSNKKTETQKSSSQQHASPQGGRTAIIPPPTANIPNRQLPAPQQGTPQQYPPQSHPQTSPTWPRPSPPSSPQADFAPNAFSSPTQYAQMDEGSRWYDRLMDVLLGEDETLPGKRFALVCSKCRLVNGQAPPGVKSLQDLGKWKCMACGTMNGEENEVRKIVKSLKSREGRESVNEPLPKVEQAEPKAKVGEDGKDREGEEEEGSDVTQYSSDEYEEVEHQSAENVEVMKQQEEAKTPRRRSSRVRRKTDTDDD